MCAMKKKRRVVYNPELELAKGATLDAASYDKTQKIKVTASKVTVGGISGRAEISGIATGGDQLTPDMDRFYFAALGRAFTVRATGRDFTAQAIGRTFEA